MKIRIYKQIIILASIVLLFSGCRLSKQSTITGTLDIGGAYEEMYNADFWIDEDYDKEILDSTQVQQYKEQLYSSKVFKYASLTEHPEYLSAQELRERITAYVVPSATRYTGSQADTVITREYFNKINANRNLSAIKDVNPVKYAIIANETSLRDFPDDAPVYEEKGIPEMDLFYENRMKVWEKCLILHTSADGKWYYVQGMSYSGWIKSADAAECDMEAWQIYNNNEFLTVTGNRIILDADPYEESLSRKEITMGTYLPLIREEVDVNNVSTVSSYTVLLPARDENGKFIENIVRVPKSADVVKGYLAFTRENIIRQSFKMLGERYGWGGSLNARDCSTFIRDIYFCFGLELPRNSASQGVTAGDKTIDVENMNDKDKEKIIIAQEPGTILEMQGHVMLYLGEYEGKAYVIHAVYAFGESGKNGVDGRKTINCVTVSDLYVTRKDGSTFLQNIRHISPVG